MTITKCSGKTLLMAWVVTTTMATAPVSSAEIRVDPAAVEILARMTGFTSGLQSFEVTTQVTLEDLLDNGQRIDFDVSSNVSVRRPNKLRAERSGEGISQAFYYDGEALTLFDPVYNVYAAQPAPDTIEGMLDYVREELGLVIPASDLAYRNAFAILMQNVIFAAVVGEAFIEGQACTHLAFRRPDVDFQVWVANGDVPYPCKFVVTDTSTEQLISTVTVMSDWKFDPEVEDAVFKFVPSEGDREVLFVPLDN